MSDPLDLLQIKIDKAKAQLPEETRKAIEVVDWKSSLIKLRTNKGYTFEQLENLEIETDLLLAGLITTAEYPKELESRMRIPKEKVKELVADMNEMVFSKIKAELIKNSERNKTVRVQVGTESKKPQVASPIFDLPELEMPKHEEAVLSKAGIEVISRGTQTPNVPKVTPVPIVEKLVEKKLETLPPVTIAKVSPEIKKEVEPAQKQVNALLAQKLSSSFQIPAVKSDHSITLPRATIAKDGPKMDPYREIPE